MTIAIGMLHEKGVLMCADSLVTTGTLASYQSKILGYRIDGADVVCAMAGNVDLAESAWQLCRPAIMKHAGKNSTAQQIADSLRPVLAKEFQQNVVDTGWQQLHDYCFVIAIRADGQDVELHHTYAKTLKKSTRGQECIGAGSDIAKFLLTWVHTSSLSPEKLADVVGYVVGTLKQQMQGVIGGNNLIVTVGNDGEILFFRRTDMELIEHWAPTYEIESYQLRWKFLDRSISEDSFKEELDHFCKMVGYFRGQFKQEGDRILYAAPPEEAKQAIIDLRTA